MSDIKATSDEAIGRPKEWREGRYQQADKPADKSVNTQSQPNEEHPKPPSVPVTRKDYEQP